MNRWRTLLVAVLGALTVAGAGTMSAAAEPRDSLIQFDSMTPIGSGAPTARGLPGGGLPWTITAGSGAVDRQGDVRVMVKGLVLAAGPKTGQNPFPEYEAAVSCLTPGGVMNVVTPGAATDTPGGDATIEANVMLPHPCNSPEVFVGAVISGEFHWFAVSNVEEEQD